MKLFLVGVGLAAAVALSGPALAADLRLGYAQAPTSIDPHFHNSGTNTAFALNVFDPLIRRDDKLQLQPALATSWTAISETEWEIKLRQGVTFHNGAPFTADDVVFTFERLPDVPDSPSSFAFAIDVITEIEAVDDFTLRLTTDGPVPDLPGNLSYFVIVSDEVGKNATTDDYIRGDAMIGTGPYKFVSSRAGEIYELERNPDYWAGAEPWQKLTIRVIDSGPARVAALLAGDVDVIERVPANDVARIKRSGNATVWSGPTNRVVFIALDVMHEAPLANHATDKSGQPLQTNPMLDRRVRQALSQAINREALIDRALGGDGVLTSNLVPEGFFGHNASIPVEPYDPEGARALLAEAGYPEGFNMVFHASTDRIAYAADVVQALAQLWARIGITTELQTMPHAVYIPKANDFAFSHMLHSWGTGSGEAAYTLNGIAVTRDKPNGKGPSNRGRYSSAQVDEMVAKAQRTLDAELRRTLLEDAMKVVIEDYAIIPLYAQKATWATRSDLTYLPQVSQFTLGSATRPAK